MGDGSGSGRQSKPVDFAAGPTGVRIHTQDGSSIFARYTPETMRILSKLSEPGVQGEPGESGVHVDLSESYDARVATELSKQKKPAELNELTIQYRIVRLCSSVPDRPDPQCSEGQQSEIDIRIAYNNETYFLVVMSNEECKIIEYGRYDVLLRRLCNLRSNYEKYYGMRFEEYGVDVEEEQPVAFQQQEDEEKVVQRLKDFVVRNGEMFYAPSRHEAQERPATRTPNDHGRAKSQQRTPVLSNPYERKPENANQPNRLQFAGGQQQIYDHAQIPAVNLSGLRGKLPLINVSKLVAEGDTRCFEQRRAQQQSPADRTGFIGLRRSQQRVQETQRIPQQRSPIHCAWVGGAATKTSKTVNPPFNTKTIPPKLQKIQSPYFVPAGTDKRIKKQAAGGAPQDWQVECGKERSMRDDAPRKSVVQSVTYSGLVYGSKVISGGGRAEQADVPRGNPLQGERSAMATINTGQKHPGMGGRDSSVAAATSAVSPSQRTNQQVCQRTAYKYADSQPITRATEDDDDDNVQMPDIF